MELNARGIKRDVRQRARRKPLAVPANLAAALARNKKASVVFESFSPSQTRDDVDWITEAKRDETRAPACDGHRMDRAGQGAQLEVRAVSDDERRWLAARRLGSGNEHYGLTWMTWHGPEAAL